MIQVNELRLGNFLMLKKSRRYIQFKSFKWLHNVYMNTEDYAPIPLTEEILLECGFIPLSDYLFIMEWDESVEIEIMKDKFYPSISAGEYHIGKELKYLHQLQNLYFALTGQELTVNI